MSYGTVNIPTSKEDAQKLLEEKGALALDFGRQKFAAMKEYADKGDWTWKIAGLAAGLLIALDAFLSFFSSVFSLSPFTAILNVYLIIFGLIAALLEYKEAVLPEKYLAMLRKQALFLYRPYGRAAFYILIGVLIMFSGGLLGFLIGIYTVVVGSIIFYSSQQAVKALSALREASFDEATIAKKFQEFDTDNSGSLDTKEIAALCQSLGSKLTLNELESALLILDNNGDGKVVYSEFLDWWKGKDFDGMV